MSYADARLNGAVYGADGGAVVAEQILNGMVDPPRELMPLYRALEELAGTAQVRELFLALFSFLAFLA